jgi:hypothetical protein
VSAFPGSDDIDFLECYGSAPTMQAINRLFAQDRRQYRKIAQAGRVSSHEIHGFSRRQRASRPDAPICWSWQEEQARCEQVK